MRWRVPVEIDRSDLEALIEASQVTLERESHRLVMPPTGGGGDREEAGRR